MSAFTLLRIVGLAASLSLTAAGTNSLAAPSLGTATAPLGAVAAGQGGDRVFSRGRDQAREEPLRLAQADCSGAAAQAAAQSGGEVLSVSSREENGQTVCVVRVLVPGQDGAPPERVTITLPG